MGISAEQLAAKYPILFHMAAEGSWQSIATHGLLSTTALVELFEINSLQRVAIEQQHRPECIPITHPVHGRAIVRDQKPMSDEGLTRGLQDGLTPTDWYGILNGKTFFWLTRQRLDTMMNARAYRKQSKTVLLVDSAELLRRHADRVVLAPMNTGATKPFPFPRGLSTFRSLDQYPYDERVKKNRKDPIVELAVEGSVPDIREYVVRVEEVRPGVGTKILFQR